ncbi:MAG TPA: hypothetical protein VFV98_11100 [Vicinamibacterales bacterium]|nr:hypothetical protein [Vicinamibacterales bacterium]
MPSFALDLPVDPRYRVLGPEVAGRYVEVLGGSESDRKAFAAAVAEAMATVAHGAAADGQIDLKFKTEAAGIEVECRCDGRSSVVRHALAAAGR